MHKISNAVKRDDAIDKSSGKTQYLADMALPDMLYMAFRTAEIQHGIINKIAVPEMPENYTIVDASDFKGQNRAAIVAEDWPFFAEDEVLYFGQPVLAISGPSLETCRRLCAETTISYEEKPAVSVIEEAEEFFNDYTIVKGKPDEAFDEASRIFKHSYRTGIQEQAYMETQSMLAQYKDGQLTVYGSMQCPYYIKNSLIKALALDPEKVRVVQASTGGAFGGKEDFPTILAGQAAAAAVKTGHPVKIVLDRHQDMLLTPKRHPSLIEIKTAVDPRGNIRAMDIDCRLDAGAYQTLSGVVLERAVFICTGAYNIENVRVRGRTMKTNHVPSGAFRGFGGPQALFAAEMNMDFIAEKLKTPPLNLKKKYLYKQGDYSVTNGLFRDEVKLDEMIKKIEILSDYSYKWKKYNSDKSNRGIGISFAAHGGGFTGSGEQDIIKGIVRLSACLCGNKEEQIRILVSNVEMGQGASMTLRKIAAQAMELPLESVIYETPDTDIVPDSGPTVASRTIMVVGKLLKDAASELKAKLDAGNKPEKDLPVTVTKQYVHPEEFKWDEKTFNGDAYPGYSWSVNVVEVELDPVTYAIEVTGSWAVYDVGTPIDIKILKGQMQGGTTQSLAYSGIEVMEISNGKPAQASFTDYIIPTALDFPDTVCEFVDNPYKYGPFGAKAAGELPNEGPAAAFASAVSQAAGRLITEIPITPEKLEALLR